MPGTIQITTGQALPVSEGYDDGSRPELVVSQLLGNLIDGVRLTNGVEWQGESDRPATLPPADQLQSIKLWQLRAVLDEVAHAQQQLGQLSAVLDAVVDVIRVEGVQLSEYRPSRRDDEAAAKAEADAATARTSSVIRGQL